MIKNRKLAMRKVAKSVHRKCKVADIVSIWPYRAYHEVSR